jgi:hypothetical protein
MHSWRVLILPYLEHRKLYDAYDFNEPWDGLKNRKLWDKMPDVYRCAGCASCRGHGVQPYSDRSFNAPDYMAIVGRETAWPGDRGAKRSDFSDPLSDTMTVIEYTGSNQPWTAPVDLTLDEALSLFEKNESQGHVGLREDYFSTSPSTGWYGIGTVDAHSGSISSLESKERVRAMLTIAGGEDLTRWKKTDSPVIPGVTIVRYERVYAVGALIILALLPAWRLNGKPLGKPSGETAANQIAG